MGNWRDGDSAVRNRAFRTRVILMLPTVDYIDFMGKYCYDVPADRLRLGAADRTIWGAGEN